VRRAKRAPGEVIELRITGAARVFLKNSGMRYKFGRTEKGEMVLLGLVGEVGSVRGTTKQWCFDLVFPCDERRHQMEN
jgi:hypothetical protein